MEKMKRSKMTKSEFVEQVDNTKPFNLDTLYQWFADVGKLERIDFEYDCYYVLYFKDGIGLLPSREHINSNKDKITCLLPKNTRAITKKDLSNIKHKYESSISINSNIEYSFLKNQQKELMEFILEKERLKNLFK